MRYPIRWASGGSVVVALLAGAMLSAAPAVAQGGFHTLSYSPPGSLSDGELVAVTGTGFDPRAKPISLIECAFQTGGSADCALGTLRITKSNRTGTFTVPDYVMHQHITTFNGRNVDCAVDTCSLSAQNLSAVPLFSDGIIIQLPFGPPWTLSAAIHFLGTVTPDSGLPSRAGVATVTGTLKCTRPAQVNVQAQLAQVYRRFIFRSEVYLQVMCSATSPFSLVFPPQTGLFAPGPAEVSLFAFGSAGGTPAQTQIINAPVRLQRVTH